MDAFRVLVGQYEIVATTGAESGRKPTAKSQAVAFDVIDRTALNEARYACRDQDFWDAWFFCVRRSAITAATRH